MQDAADIFAAAIAADGDGLLQLGLAAPPLFRIAARDVAVEIEPERKIDADAVLLELLAREVGIDRAGIERGRLDEVVTELSGLSDRARAFIVAPAGLHTRACTPSLFIGTLSRKVHDLCWQLRSPYRAATDGALTWFEPGSSDAPLRGGPRS